MYLNLRMIIMYLHTCVLYIYIYQLHLHFHYTHHLNTVLSQEHASINITVDIICILKAVTLTIHLWLHQFWYLYWYRANTSTFCSIELNDKIIIAHCRVLPCISIGTCTREYI